MVPIDLTSMEQLADSAPVRKLLNMVLLYAIKDHASDIHLEPFEDEFRIRIKADGVLYEMVPPPRPLGLCHYDSYQGDGEPGHCRAAVCRKTVELSSRSVGHPVDFAGERIADAVWRKRPLCGCSIVRSCRSI
jgi:hypothetical protein